MERLPPAEEHPYDPPEGEPNPLIAMSVRMGVDLTPNEDLEQRLDAVVAGAKMFKEELDAMEATIKAYEGTVDGLQTPEEVCPCAGGTCDECQKQEDTEI